MGGLPGRHRERLARQHGGEALYLFARSAIHAARRFYSELGYVEPEGQTPHLVRWPELDETGAIGEGQEWCSTFTKRLEVCVED